MSKVQTRYPSIPATLGFFRLPMTNVLKNTAFTLKQGSYLAQQCVVNAVPGLEALCSVVFGEARLLISSAPDNRPVIKCSPYRKIC